MGLFGKSSGFHQNKSAGEKAAATAKISWRVLTFPFRALWAAIAFAGKLTANWWKDRRMVHLLRGIPTLLLAGVCAYFVVGMQAGATRGEVYREAGIAASNAGDWKKCCLYLKRAYAFGIRDNETLFTLARAAESSSDTATMVNMLNRLAPADQPGHASAHLWKAHQILTTGNIGQEQADLARVHLQHVLTIDPKHMAAHAILGDMYFQQQIWNNAVHHLEQADPRKPKYRLMLAKACLQLGDRIKAERYARDAEKWAASESRSRPDDVEARLRWSDANAFLEEHDTAAKILMDGIALQDHPQLRAGLARVYIFQADAIRGSSDEDQNRKFVLLSQGMLHNPNDVFIFDRLMRILDRPGTVASSARDFLQNNIAEGRAVGVSHLILGTAAWIEDDEENASVHLQRAFSLMPQALTVANNFAWYLVNKDPAEPERALEMIQPVVSKEPKNHYVRDTRGHIFLKLGRWKEAIDDLEYAVAELRNHSSTHRGLATAYEKLGLTDLAEKHSRIAQSLASSPIP